MDPAEVGADETDDGATTTVLVEEGKSCLVDAEDEDDEDAVDDTCFGPGMEILQHKHVSNEKREIGNKHELPWWPVF